VAGFRYAQLCPLACAAEIVGERWTLLILRELLLGPQRFSDLTRRIPGLSSSILAERLERLESRGVVAKESHVPPTPAELYVLTPLGVRMQPALLELARWGFLFMDSRRPDDHIEPDWVRLGMLCFARSDATPPHSYSIRVPAEPCDVVFRVEGGPTGTRVTPDIAPADVSIRAPGPVLLGLAVGMMEPSEAVRTRAIEAEGDLGALPDFPALFQAPEPVGDGTASPPNQKGT
jgi:DNA-binding HxlR family transcriptional regulator